MITKMIFPGRYIQGPGAIEHLESELQNFGQTGLAIMAPSAMKLLRNRMPQPASGVRLFFEKFTRECCDREIERLAQIGNEHRAEFVVAVGGGKPLIPAK